MDSQQHQRAAPRRGKRDRSFGGCTTCRTRRIKCGQERPACVQCSLACLTCGYEASLFFDVEQGMSAGTGRFRRPLLSIQQRESMSEELTSSVPPHLVLWCLEQIDEQSFRQPALQDVAISKGPFSVFKAAKSQPEQSSPSTDVSEAQFEDLEQNSTLTVEEHAYLLQDTSWAFDPQTMFDAYLGGVDPVAVWDDMLDCGRVHEILDDTTNNHYLNQEQAVQPFGGARALESQLQQYQLPISRAPTPNNASQVDAPQNAAWLLKHYLGNVLKSLTPFQHSKTPWHILFIPEVKKCLAGLALQEHENSASLAVFYGTLAISAVSLGSNTQSEFWTRCADVYRQRAYCCVRRSMDHAYDVPKKAKYKTQLMALLTMAQLSILSGDRRETRNFLLEAEKFIRIRGLNRKKSRKVRLLHHCYAYERIFFESTTSVEAESRTHHRRIRNEVESSGAGIYSKDTLSFRLPKWHNLENDMLKIKDQELGENDLHLQLPGYWLSSLYEEIFGLPETDLFLVSSILRLAREKNGELEDDEPSTLSLKDFTSRAKAIERCIKQHRRTVAASDNAALAHLIDATHHAMLIYFYRRIHDVDASMLQGKVSDVRKALLSYELTDKERGFASVRLVWPAFVAACEAEESATQTWFAQWFETASQQSGLRLFDTTMAEIERIWQEKRRQGTANTT